MKGCKIMKFKKILFGVTGAVALSFMLASCGNNDTTKNGSTNTTTKVVDTTIHLNPLIPKIITDGNNENCIIAVIDIKNDEDIKDEKRIINSYEESKRSYYEKSQNIELINENEIKECEISIDNIKIPFNYFHKFDEKKTYNIKYSFRNNLTKENYMLYECESLISIDL
jgi:ABC-type oligopeptide transport system substrate-binding subunit